MLKRFSVLLCFVLQALQTGVCKLGVRSPSNFIIFLHPVSYFSLCRNKCFEIETHLVILISLTVFILILCLYSDFMLH